MDHSTNLYVCIDACPTTQGLSERMEWNEAGCFAACALREQEDCSDLPLQQRDNPEFAYW